jgi:NADH-ubiquinone oxidoreductase chain 5
MLSTLILLPLFSFIVVFLSGRWLGFSGAAVVTTLGIFVSFLLSCLCFYQVVYLQQVLLVDLGSWFSVAVLQVHWAFVCDVPVAVMLVVVTSVSTLVHFYSVGYMQSDPHFPRFMSYLSLFSFFMLILVSSTNFLQLFLGWEGVGLASYLLINFWHTRLQANKSAIKAMVLNRIGDFGLAFSIFVTFYVFKSLDFFTIFSLSYSISNHYFSFFGIYLNSLNLIVFFLFVAAMGKSAQLGLHTWLPDAMEGPTPVSALIHAATMVTAGVFILIRFSPVLEYATFALSIITIFGGLTAFFAATVGLVQNDLKRVVAYSTCSQLGYMIFILGVSGYSLSLFHLMNHAFFKALLFLGAGSVIHALGDEQDMRKMGGLLKLLPFTYICMLVGSLSLMGFPFLSGFYSKDLILEVAAVNYSFTGVFSYWLITIAAFFTAFYSVRLLYLTFITQTNGFKVSFEQAHEANIFIFLPLFILSFCSIFSGYVFKDFFYGLGSFFEFNSSFLKTTNFYYFDYEFLPYYIKLIPVFFSLFGAVLSFFIYDKYFYYFDYKYLFIHDNYVFKIIYKFFDRKWYFDVIYNHFFVKTLLYFSYKFTFKLLDKGFFELLGPSGITFFLDSFNSKIKTIQSGFIFHYSFIMIFGSFLIFFYFICYLFSIFFEFRVFLIIACVFLLSFFSFYQVLKTFSQNNLNLKH